MSPEQCSGEELDARADVYSLGAMFYEMLTGGPPFRSNNLAGLISKHLHERRRRFRNFFKCRRRLSQSACAHWQRTAINVQSDAIALGRELKKALTAPVTYQPSPSTVDTTPPVEDGSLRLAAVIVALVVIVGVGIAIQFAVSRIRASREGAVEIANQKNLPVTTTSPVVEASSSRICEAHGQELMVRWVSRRSSSSRTRTATSWMARWNKARFASLSHGTYDSQSRTLTMKQTEVLSGEGWSLGEDVGKLSSDGKKISGTGKDAMGGSLGMSYEFVLRGSADRSL